MSSNRTALDKRQDQIITAFANNASTIASVLPPGVTTERLIRTLSTEIRHNPDLALCTMPSLLGSVIKACLLGLEIGHLYGHAYLVPYKKVCTLIPGYRGYIHLAHQSEKVAKVEARVVYDRDDYDYGYGTESFIKHKPAKVEDRGNLVAAYAIAFWTDGTPPQFEWMTKADIDNVRSRSAAGDKGPWSTDEAEMWRKSPVRRLAKYLPLASEFRDAAALDDAADAGEDQRLGDFLEGEFAIIDAGGEEPKPERGKRRGAQAKNAMSDKGKKGDDQPAQSDIPLSELDKWSAIIEECASVEECDNTLAAIDQSELSDADKEQAKRLAHGRKAQLEKAPA